MWNLLIYPTLMQTDPAQAFAVIDGSLCRLGRFGGRVPSFAPLATAVVEFMRGTLCTFVRENPHGLLPGLANLYCLDGDNRLRWIAEWPDMHDPCAAILGLRDGVLEAISVGGAHVRLDAADGRLLAWARPVAAAS